MNFLVLLNFRDRNHIFSMVKHVYEDELYLPAENGPNWCGESTRWICTNPFYDFHYSCHQYKQKKKWWMVNVQVAWFTTRSCSSFNMKSRCISIWMYNRPITNIFIDRILAEFARKVLCLLLWKTLPLKLQGQFEQNLL